MPHVSYFTYATPLGSMTLMEENGALTHLLMGPELQHVPAEAVHMETALIREAHRQLEEYFSGARQSFDLPIHEKGTAFQKAVWAALRQITFGQTATYAEVAQRLGRPAAARAVGAACGRNPLLILTPCHRILGASGKLTGFSAGLDIKAALLYLEGTHDQK